jgi:RNA polymerase primary sigma factor
MDAIVQWHDSLIEEVMLLRDVIDLDATYSDGPDGEGNEGNEGAGEAVAVPGEATPAAGTGEAVAVSGEATPAAGTGEAVAVSGEATPANDTEAKAEPDPEAKAEPDPEAESETEGLAALDTDDDEDDDDDEDNTMSLSAVAQRHGTGPQTRRARDLRGHRGDLQEAPACPGQAIGGPTARRGDSQGDAAHL